MKGLIVFLVAVSFSGLLNAEDTGPSAQYLRNVNSVPSGKEIKKDIFHRPGGETFWYYNPDKGTLLIRETFDNNDQAVNIEFLATLTTTYLTSRNNNKDGQHGENDHSGYNLSRP